MVTRDSQAAYFGGGGQILRIVGPDPALGDEVSVLVPTDRRWRLVTLNLLLTTDATATDRQVGLILQNNALGAVFTTGLAGAQPASTVRNYAYGNRPFVGPVVTDLDQIPLPSPLILGPGFRILTLTTNLQAGDDFLAPILLVEEWITTS